MHVSVPYMVAYSHGCQITNYSSFQNTCKTLSAAGLLYSVNLERVTPNVMITTKTQDSLRILLTCIFPFSESHIWECLGNHVLSGFKHSLSHASTHSSLLSYPPCRSASPSALHGHCSLLIFLTDFLFKKLFVSHSAMLRGYF